MAEALQIFIAYARKDASYLDELRTHFTPLQRSGKVKIWYDGKIEPGVVWEAAIKENLHSADIILMLISADAIASDYFYDKEMSDALARHAAGTARVVPLIVRPCAWQETPLQALQALPKDGLPVTEWPNRDAAYANAVNSLTTTLNNIQMERAAAAKQEERERNRSAEETRREQEAKIAAAAEAERLKKEQEQQAENQHKQAEKRKRDAEAAARRRRLEEADRLKKAEEEHQRKAAAAQQRAQQMTALGSGLRSPKIWGSGLVMVLAMMVGNWLCNREPNVSPPITSTNQDSTTLTENISVKTDTQAAGVKTISPEQLPDDVTLGGANHSITPNGSTASSNKDSDGDGVLDSKDKCPHQKGTMQNKGCPEQPVESNLIETTVDKRPEFPNGEAAMLQFLYSNIKYPAIAKENGVSGTVFLSFIVEKDGSIKNIEVVRDIGGGCGNEAVRVVSLFPKWKPGEKSGQVVRTKFTLPVKFKLE